MLVLSRRKGERIVIGRDVRITVTEVGPGMVQLGFEAPRAVRIDREEVAARRSRMGHDAGYTPGRVA